MGEFQILAEGTGEANVDSIWPVRAGSVFLARQSAVRPPIEIGGDVLHRVIGQPNTFFTDPQLDALRESWVRTDTTGTWFVGDAHHGRLESPVLLVPARVRLGMRWRTGGAAAREYEVVARDVQETGLGRETILWTIRQDTSPPIFRLYAEGWGLLSIGEGVAPDAPPISSPLRAVSSPELDRVEEAGSELVLTPIEVSEDVAFLAMRPDSVRAIQLEDGSLFLNVIGTLKGVTTGDSFRSIDLRLRGQMAVGTMESEGVRYGAYGPIERSYYQSPSGIFGMGNALFYGGALHWSVEELLLFENELGGLGASNVMLPLDEYLLVAPGQGRAGGVPTAYTRPIYGALLGCEVGSQLQTRVLQSADATGERIPFAPGCFGSGSVHHATLESLPNARYQTEERFVEAFPDARGDFRGLRIQTTVGPDVQAHFHTTPGGTIDRLTVSPEGVQHERLGRAMLPEGHVLRFAAQRQSGDLVLATFTPDVAAGNRAAYFWTATPGPSREVPPAPFVSVHATGEDMKVCWPATDDALDAADWTLGGHGAAIVVPVAENCALVVRDLEARARPNYSPSAPPPGWWVFQGTIPGIGHVKAYEPEASAFFRPVAGAWVEGERVFGEDWFAPGGVPHGNAPFGGGSHADFRGAGVWGVGRFNDFPDAHCEQPECIPDQNYVLFLSGPVPRSFAAIDPATPPQIHYRVRSGGIVVSGLRVDGVEFAEPTLLRADGTTLSITLPAEYDSATSMLVRDGGEVCGLGTRTGTRYVYCAAPDGSALREQVTDIESRPTVDQGWIPIDDATALVWAPGAAGTTMARLDLESLTVSSFPTDPSPSLRGALSLDADGVIRAPLPNPGRVTADGFVPTTYDVEALVDPALAGIGVTALVVGENLVYVTLGTSALTLRIPRTRWDRATE